MIDSPSSTTAVARGAAAARAATRSWTHPARGQSRGLWFQDANRIRRSGSVKDAATPSLASESRAMASSNVFHNAAMWVTSARSSLWTA